MTEPLDVPRAAETLERQEQVQTVDHDQVFALIYRQMRSLAGRTADLDDLAQTAVEQAIKSLPRFEGRAEVATWTYRICYHTLLNQRRWYKRWLRRFTFTAEGTCPEVPESRPSPCEALTQRELAYTVQCALEQLSAKHRVVVVLHDLEGVSLHEVAQIVDCKLHTARSRLRDGRKKLLATLRSDRYFGESESDCSAQEVA